MKRYFLLIPTLFVASMWMTSCEESSGSDLPFGSLAAAGVTGVGTKNAEEFCCWQAGAEISFTSYSSDYANWYINIGESSGTFSQVSGSPQHWSGKVTYYEKDKYCKETVYVDSLTLDINPSESGWGSGKFRTGSAQYEKGNGQPAINMVTYYIKPEGGDINTLNVYDASNTYIFRFKTRETGDINSWKIDQMPQGWMNSNGRISMLIVPILYSLFQ